MIPVLFRKDGPEIVAVFPTIDAGSFQVACYAHVGQHSGCSREWYYTTKPAKPEEYADLLAEIRQIYEESEDPVKLMVRSRWSNRFAAE